jgi:predicted DNA-binding transcriptional regulator AlpA
MAKRKRSKPAPISHDYVDPLLRWSDITSLTRVSQSTVRGWIKAGLFPKPRYIGTRSPRWKQSEILAWQTKFERT